MVEPGAGLKTEAEADESGLTLDEREVVTYLRAHPEFLAQHPDLLEVLELRHSSGAAVSLIERQVEILRGKAARLEERLRHLIASARENEKRASNVHRLARTLIRAPTLAAIVAGLRKCLREDFAVDEVFVGVSAQALKRQDIEGLIRLDARHPVVRSYDDFFRTRLVECGPIDEERARLLFPHAAALPRSAAIVPLEKEKSLGMLALGSADAERFQPRQGKLFLEMTAELVAAAIRSKLG